MQCIGTNLAIVCSSLAIAFIPLLPFAADYFVNGVYNDPILKIFVGSATKDVYMSVIEGYHGRMVRKKEGDLEWKRIFQITDKIFTHEPGYTEQETS